MVRYVFFTSVELVCRLIPMNVSLATFSTRRRSYQYVRYTTNIISAYQTDSSLCRKISRYGSVLTQHDRTAYIPLRFLSTKSSSDRCFEEKAYIDSSERFHSDQFKRYLHDLLGFYIRLEVLKAFYMLTLFRLELTKYFHTGILHVEECLACNWYQ